ncbi:MAG: hypothetical protein HRT98_02560 [Mycoplasmatales bacterium]|nr:hypothetical protein [Mycoplasmatales bacterium]
MLSEPINNRHIKFKAITRHCKTLDILFHLKVFIQVNKVAVIKRIETLPMTRNKNIKWWYSFKLIIWFLKKKETHEKTTDNKYTTDKTKLFFLFDLFK